MPLIQYYHAATAAVQDSTLLAVVVLVAAFIALTKCADVFVDCAVGLANKLNIPRLIIGIVLVSFATTVPELSVSLLSALKGNPEMALGNAIGSVICDDGLALGLAGVFAAAPIAILPSVLKTSGLFLLTIEIICFAFLAFDLTLSRYEGAILVILFIGYIVHLYRRVKSGTMEKELDVEEIEKGRDKPLLALVLLFAAGIAGIVVASEFIITSATTIARALHVPNAVIALTLVALGTSIPEVATCVVAARKKEGALAVGNIIGADIMNICWVAGASAMANSLTLGRRELFFMFPSMFVIVGAMLILLRLGYTLTRWKGVVLFGLYCLYITSFFIVFRPG